MNEFTLTLLEWYDAHKRSLPWRETSDPYRIWISEIILQQTRVSQGYDYFLRFMECFPTVDALAKASVDEVLKLWQGLGYYSRARNLHAAAQSMQGVFPATYEGVRALKGVGDYTAAAICSFAYGQPYAVVDGNVYRVLSRYFGVDIPIDTTVGKKTFAALAQEMLAVSQPADYNQAIMDFGALQCVPASPQCEACPLQEGCVAFRAGSVSSLPVKQHRTKTINRYFNYLYVAAGDYTFLRQRGANDIWQGLYEWPLIETEEDTSMEKLLLHPQFAALFPANTSLRLVRSGVKHVLSHRVIYANFYEAVVDEAVQIEGYLKVKREEAHRYAVPRLIEKSWNDICKME